MVHSFHVLKAVIHEQGRNEQCIFVVCLVNNKVHDASAMLFSHVDDGTYNKNEVRVWAACMNAGGI